MHKPRTELKRKNHPNPNQVIWAIEYWSEVLREWVLMENGVYTSRSAAEFAVEGWKQKHRIARFVNMGAGVSDAG